METGIIAFCKDWDDDPTSNHHVLRELAKTRRVVWLNSLGMRTPALGSSSDRRRILRKLREFARPPRNVENDLWVVTPAALPLPHSALAQRLNVLLLRLQVWRLTRRLGLRDFQLWTFLPNTAGYVGRLGESGSVYYCVDEFSLFSNLDRERTSAAERELLARVDVVFAVNAALADAKRPFNPNTVEAPHGVDHAHFATALDPATPVPADLEALARPVLGFYGSIDDWVDLELIAGIARLRPDWTIALIGPAHSDVSPVAGLPNVRLLGRRPHSELPAYCKGFSVGLIPYRIEERTPFVNPIKLREYLSAGLPVVSTPVHEVVRLGELCAIASDAEGFVSAIEESLRSDGPEARRRRSDAMRTETWAERIRSVSQLVSNA
jgi:glycosyltransferase involved in cell wall biosynthesis